MLRALFRATRPLAHANIAPPLFYGQALAYTETGAFSIAILFFCLVFGVLDHVFIVFANDFADRKADELNTTFNVFSGGSRALPDGLLQPRTVLAIACGAAALLMVLTVPLAEGHRLLPMLAAAAILLMLAYSYPPLALSYRGGGEWLQALGVGLVLPLVGFHAQEPSLRAIPWLAFFPTIAMGLSGNILTSLPDEPADRATSKRTWAVRRGVVRASRETMIGLATALLLGSFCLPWPSHGPRALGVALPLGALGLIVPLLPHTERPTSKELLVFMLAMGGTTTGTLLLWSVLLL